MNTIKPNAVAGPCLSAPQAFPALSRWLVTGLLALVAPIAAAQVPANITPGELALLPEYCVDVQATTRFTDPMGGNPSPRAPAWVAAMGETFWAMHHHCWALLRMHRSRQPGLSAPQREGQIRGAIGDYIYVLNNERPGFPLKPEIFARLGEAYAALPAPGEALEAYQKSREAKADYWPAYTWASDTLMVLGRRKEAIELLEQGLSIMPGNPEITRKLDQIKRGASAKATAVSKSSAREAAARRTSASASASVSSAPMGEPKRTSPK